MLIGQIGQLTASVSAFDGVFDQRALSLLRSTSSVSGLGHTLYHRQEVARTPLEYALNSVLEALGDDAPFIEYWSRQEWKHIEAHADVDEALAAHGGPLRYPRNGHVLYLQVGERVSGPTCVWHHRCADTEGTKDRFGSLVTVPAVASRVLRFDGHLQHAVPRPADVWLTSFVINEPSTPPDAYERSVVLFNTWDDPERPPLDVERSPPAQAADVEVATPEHVRCREPKLWATPPVRRLQGGQNIPMKLWLLGDEHRRMWPSRTIGLEVHKDVGAALKESHVVTIIE